MRARLPDREDFVVRDGVKVAYELYDNDAPTLLLLPTWSVAHARAWKAQIAYLARHWRVVTFDGRGNGRSDRPAGHEAYTDEEIVADAVAVLDATGTDRAVLVGWSRGGKWAAFLAGLHPDRALGAVLLAPGIPFTPHPEITAERFTADVEAPEGWDKWNANHWVRDWEDFLDFFYDRVFPEPHSTKHKEDGISWSLETTPETIVLTMAARLASTLDAEEVVGRVRCPVLVVHAEDDEINPYAWGARAAELTGGELITVEGCGHGLAAREPVLVNRLVHDFALRVTGARASAPRRWRRAATRPRRALYLSSPIGLGHVRRDLAVARELEARVDGLEIDWLSQPPVTTALSASGQRVHPASRWLASESAHLTAESGEHDLHVFEALRRMDEIMVANFMVFQDVVEDGAYDVVIADEAWDVDHFWHENPELKRASLVWMTDFVGNLPMPDGGEREARLTADYNAEMLEHVARFARIRDRAIFVGEPDDVVDRSFGPGLPAIRDWTAAHFAFSGYITGFDPLALADRAALRAELGYGEDERVCLVAVGGSGVGTDLLRRAVEAYPAAAARVDGLRMVVVAGPRIDPGSLPAPPGVEVRGYVPELHRHLAACDLALVQGGLTTTMELVATGRPFLYFPLEHHFEQQVHVRHRLDRHRAGRAMAYRTASAEVLAEAVAEEIGRAVDYRPVPPDGAARAAELIAELL